MTRFLHSRFAVIVAAAMAVAAALGLNALSGAEYPLGNEGIVRAWGAIWHLPQQAETTIALALNVAIAVLLCYLNSRYNVLRSITKLEGTLFLAMAMAIPSTLLFVYPGTILCLVMVVCMMMMCDCYERADSQRSVFLVFMLLSGCSAFDYCFLVYVPVMVLACAQMRVMSVRTMLAAAMGFVTPWIILFGFGIVHLADLRAPTIYMIGQSQAPAFSLSSALLVAVLSSVTAVAAWVQNMMKILSYNARSRAMISLVTVTTFVSVLAMCIDFTNIYGYLPMVNACASMQLAHLFGVVHKAKKSYWAILAIISVYLIVYAWEVICVL